MKNVMLFLVCIAFLCLPILASGEMSAEVAQRLKRAQQGDAKAQYALGLAYYLGKGVSQDYTEAVKWVRLAAEQGFAQAQSVLGGAYDSGVGVPQDYTEAVKWYRLAAKQGDAEAQHNLGLAYDSGVGIPQDYKEAVKWFRLAAEQGYAKAQYALGLTYYSGKGVLQDYTEAVKWYRLAAKQGVAGAQCNLGVAYDSGKGVPQDYTEAVKWFRLAAEQGFAQAQYNLGLAYYYGRGVAKDDLQACGLIKLAAEQGLVEAEKDYSTLLKEMSSQKNAPAGMLSRALKRAGSGATLMIGAVLVGGVVQLIRWLAVKGVRKRVFPFFGKQNVIFGECPRCRLLNPPTATRCDCGYDFPTGSIQKSYVTRNEAVSPDATKSDSMLARRKEK